MHHQGLQLFQNLLQILLDVPANNHLFLYLKASINPDLQDSSHHASEIPAQLKDSVRETLLLKKEKILFSIFYVLVYNSG
jgi:hypothetical protein